MSDNRWCGNPDLLMSYLYDEGDAGERQAFEAHLRDCAACDREVREFTALRTGLAQWAPPDAVLDFRIVRDQPGRSWRSWFTLPVLPGWAQLGVAAMLVGVAVGISGLEVRYDSEGVTVRTGWQRQAAPLAVPGPVAPAVVASASSDATPWRSDLAAVEERLRRELHAPVAAAGGSTQQASARTTPVTDEAFLERVRDLIAASEERQNREMALRMTQVVRDVDTQRRTDFARLTDGMGVIEGRAVSAVAQQRQMIDYLMRVSSQREPR
jgi:anti-sigma factor RsiW